jgi:hypothetical protein
MSQADSITARHRQPSVTESFALPPDKGVNHVSNPISYSALPDVPKAMRLMLVKETGGRKLRCVDCGQPDPMRSAETRAWLKGELGTRLSFVTYRDAQFWNYPLQGLLDHEDRMINS